MKRIFRNLLLLLLLLLLMVVDGMSLIEAITTPEMKYRMSIIISCSIALLACFWLGGVIVRGK